MRYFISLLNSIVYKLNNKPRLFFCIIIVFTTHSNSLFSQYWSVNNNNGIWEDSTSWVNAEIPAFSISKTDVNIYGELSANHCLDFNLNTLTVFDTLIIYGNLELKNTCSLIIKRGAILIILGDYLSKNMVDVTNNGTMIVAGRFAMQSASNNGSFINNGNLYLFDTIPEIKSGDNYTDISCKLDSTGIEKCGYKDYSALLNDGIFTYLSGLPYDLDKISIEGNSCIISDSAIVMDKTELCIGEEVTIRTDSINVEYTKNLVWDFGTDAIPKTATNIGSHEIYYTSAGEKIVYLLNSTDSSIIQSQLITVHETPINTLYLSINETNLEYDPNRDKICPGDFTSIHVNEGKDSVYHWRVPELNIDTTCSNTVLVNWDLSAGNYLVSVNEISSFACLGEPLDFMISIGGNSCIISDSAIVMDKTELCIGEEVTIRTDSINVEYTKNLVWDFGTDAIPKTATNIGSHEVYYTSAGEKIVYLLNSTDSSIIQSKSITVHETPQNALYLSLNDTDIAYNPYRNDVCTGEIVLLNVTGGTASLYHWRIPNLNIDTICNNTLEVNWNLPSGEYLVSVNELSTFACVGEPLDVEIFIDVCADDILFTDEFYAFTPNGDGFNDFWEIPHIENYPYARIIVFDRNGKLVFSSEGYYKNDWDGTIDGRVLDLNSYFFIIDFSVYQKSEVRGVLTILHE